MTNDERDRLLMEIHSAVHTNSKTLESHDKTLYGNGQIGYCERLQLNESAVAAINTKLETSSLVNHKWLAGIIAVCSILVPTVVTLLLPYVKALFKVADICKDIFQGIV